MFRAPEIPAHPGTARPKIEAEKREEEEDSGKESHVPDGPKASTDVSAGIEAGAAAAAAVAGAAKNAANPLL